MLQKKESSKDWGDEMEPLEELMLNIKKKCQEELREEVNLAELPKEGGTYAELGVSTEKCYIRSGRTIRAPVLFMRKGAVEPECIRILSKIGMYFEKNKRKLDGITYRVKQVSVQSGPHKTGRMEDGQPVYSSIIHFEIY